MYQECRHIKTNGQRCHGPALRGNYGRITDPPFTGDPEPPGLLSVEDDSLSLSGFDLEASTQVDVSVTADTPGTALVSGRYVPAAGEREEELRAIARPLPCPGAGRQPWPC